jgi:protein ImuB
MFACIYVPNFSGNAHAALLDCGSAFSPRVENTMPGTIVFDLEGLERLFGSYSEIAEKVAEQVRAAGLQANVAVASNPDAAICAARGFAGVTVLSRGTEARRLRDLPLDVLSPSPEFLETLERWGIRSFGAFAKLPAVQVSERLGQEGVRLHKLARGVGSRPLVPNQEALRFVEIMELDYEIVTIEPLTFILSRLLDQICSRLRSRNLATHEVHLTLGSYVRVLHLPLPIRNPRLLTKLLILDLEAHSPRAPIKQVKVEAIPAKPRIVQNGLFVPLSPEPEKLELTLARISAVVGEENVGSPEILDTHRPDAFRVKKFGDFGIRISDFGFESTRKPPVALRLFRPPLEATVQIRDGTPHWIAMHGVHGPIETASGPWRTSGDWWRPDTWDREEWDIEVLPSPNPNSEIRIPKSLYRIYYDVHTDRWFAQGVYD